MSQEQAVQLFSLSPALFVENQGQWADPSVRYVHQGSDANVAMTDAGPVFQVFRQEAKKPTADSLTEDMGPEGIHGRFAPEAYETQAIQFSASFVGANLVTPVGLDLSQTQFNYFVGDQANWRSEVPSYEKVAYEGLYEGVDLYTWGHRDSLKYEFQVTPGADWSAIQVRYEGIEGLSLAEDGSLVVDLGEGWGSLTDDAPYIYQVVDGEQVAVAGRFGLVDGWTYSFEITGQYDPSLTLVIDPDLAWSTYLGGSGDDSDGDIAVDSSGNALVTGSTSSTNFSGASNAYKGGSCDAFVAKVSSGGSLLWATYLGGSGNDYGSGIAVDSSGNALVTGQTSSTDFSGASNAFKGGTYDAFVAKVSSDGSLAWATYLGGSGWDYCYGIAVDSSGDALVTGGTGSTDFCGANNAYKGGTHYDAFVAKVSSDGSPVWATYLGGSSSDEGCGIAVDSSGDALVTGDTLSTDFSGANNPYIGRIQGHTYYWDAFVAKVSSTGSLVWARYLGGSSSDAGFDIAVDSSGDALVTGETKSPDFCGANNAFKGGTYDAFVAKVSSDGLRVLWATYLGGSSSDFGGGIAVDSLDNALVTGRTWSTNFSGASNAYMGGTEDAFVAKVSSVDGSLAWATYLGGSGNDYGGGIAVDSSGNALVTGGTDSPNFSGAINPNNGGWDAFVAKIDTVAAPGPQDFFAVGDTTPSGPSGTFTGTYQDTFASDNVYEALTEILSAKTSILEHTWTFNLSGGTTRTFYVEAYHSGTEDNFKFQYSTDGRTWTDMLTVTKTIDNNTAQSFSMPSGLSGTVYVRVIDTNRAANKKVLDTLSVDLMYIRCA
jgi:hypothetical protein